MRNDMDFDRGTFRVRGDVLEVIPAITKDYAIRIEFFGDEQQQTILQTLIPKGMYVSRLFTKIEIIEK